MSLVSQTKVWGELQWFLSSEVKGGEERRSSPLYRHHDHLPSLLFWPPQLECHMCRATSCNSLCLCLWGVCREFAQAARVVTMPRGSPPWRLCKRGISFVGPERLES